MVLRCGVWGFPARSGVARRYPRVAPGYNPGRISENRLEGVGIRWLASGRANRQGEGRTERRKEGLSSYVSKLLRLSDDSSCFVRSWSACVQSGVN